MTSSLSSCGLFATMSILSLLIYPCHLEKEEFRGFKVSCAFYLYLLFPLTDTCSCCLRSPAGLFSHWRLLPKSLLGGTAAEGSGRGSSRVQRDPSNRYSGAEGADDQTYVWWPLCCQSEFYSLDQIIGLSFFFFTSTCDVITEPAGQTCHPLPPTFWPASGKCLQTSHQGICGAKSQCKTDT